MKPRKSQPERVGNLISQVLEDLGVTDGALVLQIAERWEEAVGPDIARHCRATGLRGKLLEVSVDSSVWCQQLQLQAPSILDALRSTFGESAPSEIWFRVGR